jgi:hypothetical protein
MVAPASGGGATGARGLRLPCVLRESSYSYCDNPSTLTREATGKMMESLYEFHKRHPAFPLFLRRLVTAYDGWVTADDGG